jgi:hypothetical protein
MPSDLRFHSVQFINHNGSVVVFGESRGQPQGVPGDLPHKLWYKVLDLEQVADADDPNAWDDNTRWTGWMEVPYPEELRIAGMGILTVNLQVSDELQSRAGRWRALSDGTYIYVFRAIDLALARGKDWANQPEAGNGSPSATSNIRVYANRYALIRDASPLGGTNRGASGKEIMVPQLKPAFEARYRRSRMRETPQSDADGQGYLDMGGEPFLEPTMEFSMVTPVDGLFTVTLAPSAVPGRKRWQFFWKAADSQLAALSPVSYTHLTLPTTPYV